GTRRRHPGERRLPPSPGRCPARAGVATGRGAGRRATGGVRVSERLHEVSVTVNGALHRAEVPARRLLSDFLRHDLRLTGTHVGCEHGVCGACTILLDGLPVRSCLTFAVSVDGAAITTVEGLAAEDGT